MILAALPLQGTLVGGAYPDAANVRDVIRSIGIDGLDTTLVSTRLRVLGQFGFVQGVKIPKSPTNGYQITPAGQKLLKEWEPKEVSDGGGSDSG